MLYIRRVKVLVVLPCVRSTATEGELRLLLINVCSTVILLLLTINKNSEELYYVTSFG